MKFKVQLFFLFYILIKPILLRANDSDFIEKINNVTINWTKGEIYSEYTLLGSKNQDMEELQHTAFESAYHNLIKVILNLYFESGKKIKDTLNFDNKLENKINLLKEKIQIKKKIIYLNNITYLISIPFLDYFNQHENIVYEEIENSYKLPIKNEYDFSGIIIYIPRDKWKPALFLKIYSSNGKFLLKIPIKENIIYRNDQYVYNDPNLQKPYIIYTDKIINMNDIIIDQKDAQFLIATKKIFNLTQFKVILYDESK